MRDRARFIGFAPAEEQCARKRVRKQVFSGVLMAPAPPLAATAEGPRFLNSPPLTTTALDRLPAGERARPHSATRQSGLLTAVSAPAKTPGRRKMWSSTSYDWSLDILSSGGENHLRVTAGAVVSGSERRPF